MVKANARASMRGSRKPSAVRLAACGVMLALFATGCGQPQPMPVAAYSVDGQFLPAQPGAGLVRADEHPIADVPVPIGFVAVPSRSSSSLEGQVRQVRHMYQGRGQLVEAVRFFTRELPRFGWRDVTRREDVQPGVHMITARKGLEQLKVRLSEKNGVVTAWVLIEPANV